MVLMPSLDARQTLPQNSDAMDWSTNFAPIYVDITYDEFFRCPVKCFFNIHKSDIEFIAFCSK